MVNMSIGRVLADVACERANSSDCNSDQLMYKGIFARSVRYLIDAIDTMHETGQLYDVDKGQQLDTVADAESAPAGTLIAAARTFESWLEQQVGATLVELPYVLHPTALHPTPYTLHPTACILHRITYILQPTSHTLYSTSGCDRRSARVMRR